MADPSSFPVLSIGIDANSWRFKPASSHIIESKMENGLRSTRARHTWTPNVFPGIKISGMDNQDRLDLQAFFEDTVGHGSLPFLYFNTQDFQTYEFKFLGDIDFRLVTRMLPEMRWNATMTFVESGQTHAYAWPGGRLGEGRLGY